MERHGQHNRLPQHGLSCALLVFTHSGVHQYGGHGRHNVEGFAQDATSGKAWLQGHQQRNIPISKAMVKEGASIIVVILFAVIFIAVIVDFIRESKKKWKPYSTTFWALSCSSPPWFSFTSCLRSGTGTSGNDGAMKSSGLQSEKLSSYDNR